MEMAFVVGDIGAARELVEAARELINQGHNVNWIADPMGKACDFLSQQKITYMVRDAKLYARNYEAIIVGTSATAVTEQIEWTREGKNAGRPVIWYEDLWGTGERPATREVSPDIMLTISRSAAEIAERVRPGLKTVAVGKPSWEYLRNYNQDKARKSRSQTRQTLGIDEKEMAVLYWSTGNEQQTEEDLFRLMDIRKNDGIYFIPRLHPKMPGRDVMWGKIKELPNVLDGHGIKINADLCCAADMVLGGFGSTDTYTSAFVGTLTGVILSEEETIKRQECGFINGIPPLVEYEIAESVTKAPDFDLLVETIRDGTVDSPAIRRAAHNAFGDALQPGAAKRIAEAILQHATA